MRKNRANQRLLSRRAALTFSLGALAAVATPVFAQTQTTSEPERVIVTGSNIPSAAEVGAAPLDTVDAAAVERSGQQDVLSVLTKSDAAFSGGGNLGQSNASIASQNTYGGSTISIHGLPTLVLLNGRRVADSAAAAAGGTTFVDVNLFPTALIKKIEVLKDGASAIYGSEAIGGVVNILLNQDFRGVQIEGRYGFTEKSDIKDKRVSLIAGVGDDKTSIVIGGQYTEQDPVFTRDREWAQPENNTTNYPGVVRLNGRYYRLAPGLTTPTQVVAPGSLTSAAQLAASGAYVGPFSSGQIAGFFDNSAKTGITLDQSRTSLFGSFERKIWDDHIKLYGEFLYSHNYSQSYLQAQPINSLSTDANGVGPIIPAGSPFNPFAFTLTPGLATAPTASATGRIQINNRFIDLPRIFRNDTNFYRVVAGLKGNIIKSIDLNYDINFNTSQNEINYRNSNLPIASGLNSAIAAGTVDLFSVADQSAALSAAGGYGSNFRDLKSALNVFDAGVTLFPFNLPGGPLGFAAGFEYRFEKFRYSDSPEIFLASVPVPPINVGRDIYAFYGETSVPVISPTMKIPGVYSLDLDGAVRYEKYEGINSSIVPKVSFLYRPIEDVALRGSFSKSFIAPTLFETQGPTTTGFSNSVNLGQGVEQAQEQGGSNPALAPSRADTYTGGIVISPHQVPGLTITGDFFHVEQSNIVNTIPDVTILNSVNSLGLASPFAGLVRFGSFNGPTVTAAGQLAGNLPLYFVTDNLTNIGRVRIGGVDYGINYTHEFGRFGMTLGANGVYYLQYKQENLPGDRAYDTVGYYISQANEVPDYRLAPYAEFRYGGFKASALGNYIPSVRDAHSIDLSTYFRNQDGYLPKIRDYYTIDLFFSYEFGLGRTTSEQTVASKDSKDARVTSSKDKNPVTPRVMSINWLDGLKLGFGINNVTNARPPFIAGSPDATNTDAAIYDPYQRQYYFTISKKF